MRLQTVLFALALTTADAFAGPAGTDPRAATDPQAATAPAADAAMPGGDYDGTYPLLPGFDLAVRERDGTLEVQGTGQPAVPLSRTGDDAYAAPAIGLVIRFLRDGDGRVEALELRQHGKVLRGERR